MTVAFVDLDKTLIDVNSGELWVRHEWSIGRLGFVDASRAAWWLVRYAFGDDTLEPALRHAASLYRGFPEAQMRDEVGVWFEREVRPRVRPGALDALARHRDAGHTLVLATSSSQWAAACARDAWSLDAVVSTVADVADGHLTGTLAELAFGHHKLDACRRWAEARGIDLADATFYTDSYSDLSLLEAVGNPVVVAPDRRLARAAAARGWPIVDWGKAPP